MTNIMKPRCFESRNAYLSKITAIFGFIELNSLSILSVTIFHK